MIVGFGAFCVHEGHNSTIILSVFTLVMVNRAIGMKKDGSWRAKHFEKNDQTLAFLSDITVNLGLASALAPVAVQGLGVVQAAVSKRAPS